MKSRTLGILFAGGLVAAVAVLASPVAAHFGRAATSDAIQFNWSRTTGPNDFVDQTWWAIRSHCAPDSFAEKLLCIPVGLMARGAGAGFEATLSKTIGWPIPEGWARATAKNAPQITSIYVETSRDLASVLTFYRAELDKRGWIEKDGAVVAPDRAMIAFTTSGGPGRLRLSREGGRTIAELSMRKPGTTKADIVPKPGQVRLMFGNKTDDDATFTVNEQTIKVAAGAGGKLANTADEAEKLPDDQKLDLPPGRYKVTLKVAGGTTESREFEIAANETWGLLVGPDGAPLPMHLY